MGQGASKAFGRVISSGAKTTHIPSIPGKSGTPSSVAPDPFSGFTRGGKGVGMQQEEAQRHFLQSQQGDPSSIYSDKLPDDLIKFMTDVGPLKTDQDHAATTTKRLRIPRMSGSLFAPTLVDTYSTAKEEEPTKSQSPAHDKTRRTESMRLAENIAGIETSRTTSFSHKQDVANPNEIAGLDVVQMYGLLTGASSPDSYCDDNSGSRAEKLHLLEQSMGYLQVPVLLRDSDRSFVGAWPEKVGALQQAHQGMEIVPQSRAKLVLEDLWELEQRNSSMETPVSR
jgi:hypothetical protein